MRYPVYTNEFKTARNNNLQEPFFSTDYSLEADTNRWVKRMRKKRIFLGGPVMGYDEQGVFLIKGWEAEITPPKKEGLRRSEQSVIFTCTVH